MTSLLACSPLKRVVLIADRGLLSVNNFDELAALQAALKAQDHEVAVDYILGVPASRYGDFADSLGAMAKIGRAHV